MKRFIKKVVNVTMGFMIAFFIMAYVSVASEPYMVKDIYPGNNSSGPEYLTSVNGILYFRAGDGINGSELWKSDGTAIGTMLVKDIRPGNNSYPAYLTNVNGILYFMADDGINGSELWKSDGTEIGTILVKDIYPGHNDSSKQSFKNNFAAVNNYLYFDADDGSHGCELWKSDGSESGTVLVKDINPGSGNSNPFYYYYSFKSIGNTLYFTADDGTHGFELWKSDGSESGTVMVKDIYPGSEPYLGFNTPSYFTIFNNMLYFSAEDGTNGRELWKSDGSESGTVMVKDINPGSGYSSPSYLININGTLYFSANNGINGFELWKSDGTATGTVMVKDIYPGSGHSSPDSLTNVNGILYFVADDGVHGRELWKSDGTATGTVMVKDIYPGDSPIPPYSLTDVNGKLYFVAYDETYGAELWESDGTETGTFIVEDIYPGSWGSVIENMTNANGKLYFSAADETHGGELWSLSNLPSTTTTVQPTTTISTTTTTTVLPTVVNLVDFNAIPSNSKVILNWSTESEIDNAGFNIYRAESQNGNYIKINPALIPAKGTASRGALYEFVDTNVRNRKTYYYKLEDIDLNGTSTMHGPVLATPRLIFGFWD